MLPTLLLHFGAYSFLFVLLLTAAAQAAPSSVKKPEVKDELSNVARLTTPGVLNPRVEKLTIIDASCPSSRKAKVTRALSDAYYMAEIAQYITKDDQAFKNYFLPDNLEKPNAIFKFLKDIVLGPEHEDDSKMVPNMFKSILSGGVSDDKAPHKIHNVCSTTQDSTCGRRFAYVRSDQPSTIYWCPRFFGNSAISRYDLSEKKFDPEGWCKGPPHILGNLMTTADTVLHEMTHLPFVVSHALALSLGEGSVDVYGTVDVLGKPDENDKNNLKTYGGFDTAVARKLKQRWAKYIAQTGFEKKHLNKPPVATSMNAESYSGAATEYFFYAMCAQHGFNPTQVEARLK